MYALGYCFADVRRRHDGLILGYANLPQAAIDEGVRRLAEAYATVTGARARVTRSRSRTNAGGAIPGSGRTSSAPSPGG